jgi:exopolysaccharide production protein ExoZ
MNKQRLFGLEFGRGIAASLVAMHHASNLLSQPKFSGAPPFHNLMRQFDVGVDFFFVLSGFIIMWVHSSDIGKPTQLGSYVMRRWTRVYPPYWCVLIPISILYFLFPGTGKPSQHDPVNFILSFFLLPNMNQPVLGVAWTLVYEIFFYTVFGLLIVIGKRGWLVLLLWIVAILYFATFADQASWPQNFFFNSLNLEFLIGIVVARMLSIARVIYPGVFIIAGLIAFALICLLDFGEIYDPSPLAQHVMLGTGAAAIIAGLVELERSSRITFGRFAQILGSASFSIYLVHSVIQSWVATTAWQLMKGLPGELAWLFLIVIGIGAGLLFHRFVERPLIEFIRTGFAARSAKVEPV